MTSKAEDLADKNKRGALEESPDVGARPFGAPLPANDPGCIVGPISLPRFRARCGTLGGCSFASGALDWPAIVAPVGPLQWLVRELHIAPGRPALLVGAPGAGKTWIACALALSIGSGGKVDRALDAVGVQRFGRVVHLNFDYPEKSTRRRYRRLAHGLNIGARGIVPDVALYSRKQLGGFTLAAPGAKARLLAMVGGATLCIIDALRGALPGVDLNASEVRVYLDLLMEVSDLTGCVFLVIHHDRKASLKDEGALRQDKAGGSHQIVAGCDVTLHVEKDGPFWRLVAGKVSEGKANEEGYLVELKDIGDTGPDEVSEGVFFSFVPGAEVADRKARQVGAGAGDRLRGVLAAEQAMMDQVYRMIVDAPGKVTVNAAKAALGCRKDAITDALDALERDGRIENLGSKLKPKWRAADGPRVSFQESSE